MPVKIDNLNKVLSYLNTVYDHMEDHEQVHVQGLQGLFRHIRDYGDVHFRIRKLIRTLLCLILVIINTEEKKDATVKLQVIKHHLKQLIDTLKLNSHMQLCIFDRDIDKNTRHWSNIQFAFGKAITEIG